MVQSIGDLPHLSTTLLLARLLYLSDAASRDLPRAGRRSPFLAGHRADSRLLVQILRAPLTELNGGQTGAPFLPRRPSFVRNFAQSVPPFLVLCRSISLDEKIWVMSSTDIRLIRPFHFLSVSAISKHAVGRRRRKTKNKKINVRCPSRFRRCPSSLIIHRPKTKASKLLFFKPSTYGARRRTTHSSTWYYLADLSLLDFGTNLLVDLFVSEKSTGAFCVQWTCIVDNVSRIYLGPG